MRDDDSLADLHAATKSSTTASETKGKVNRDKELSANRARRVNTAVAAYVFSIVGLILTEPTKCFMVLISKARVSCATF